MKDNLNHQVTLENAIHLAIKNGWVLEGFSLDDYDYASNVFGAGFMDRAVEDATFINYEAIIFNHEFAKAIWGKTEIASDEDYFCMFRWEQHLAHMVIAPDPIEYLSEHLYA